MIAFSFRLTERDLVVAQRRGFLRGFRWLAAVPPVVMLFDAANNIVLPFGNWDYSILSVVAVACFFLFGFWRAGLTARAIYTQQPSLSEEVHVSLDDELASFAQASGNAEIRWSELHLWNEWPELFALYPNQSVHILIPKATMPANGPGFLRARLMNTGLEKGRTRKGPEVVARAT